MNDYTPNAMLEDALRTFFFQDNDVLRTLYSSGNINFLHKTITSEVQKRTGIVIPRQSNMKLHTYMLNAFKMHHDDQQFGRMNLNDSMTQVNNIVLNKTVTNIVSEILHQQRYRRLFNDDKKLQNDPHVPSIFKNVSEGLMRPISTTSAGTKTIVRNIGFEDTRIPVDDARCNLKNFGHFENKISTL